MTVGQLARRTGLTPRSIRRFEGLGLIYSVGRSPANYRLFDESALWCVEIIRNLRALGLTVREIRQLASIYLDGPDESVGPLLAEQLATARRRIDARVAELNRVRDRLDVFERSNAAALTGARPISSWAGDPRRAADGA
jgi:DNA-binding transcriptional MerR regulator